MVERAALDDGPSCISCVGPRASLGIRRIAPEPLVSPHEYVPVDKGMELKLVVSLVR